MRGANSSDAGWGSKQYQIEVCSGNILFYLFDWFGLETFDFNKFKFEISLHFLTLFMSHEIFD